MMKMNMRWKSAVLPLPRPLPSQGHVHRKEKWTIPVESTFTAIPDRHCRRKDHRHRRQYHPVAEDGTAPISMTARSSQPRVAFRWPESSSMGSRTMNTTAPTAMTQGPRPTVTIPFLLVCLQFLFRSRLHRGVRGQLRLVSGSPLCNAHIFPFRFIILFLSYATHIA